MNLHKYGIFEEQSDIRAHVSLPGKCITVYRTADMVSLINDNIYPQMYGYQEGIESATALGYLVPLDAIRPKFFLKSRLYPWDNWCHDSMTLEEKGNMAVKCVRAAILSNRFPLWVCGCINEDKELDILGTDIIVIATRRIQVKYDYGAYYKREGGTGNLYIQTHERNPSKIYSSEKLFKKSPTRLDGHLPKSIQ